MSYEKKLMKELISFETDSMQSKDYAKAAKFLKKELERLHFNVNIYDANKEIITNNNMPRPNVVASLDVSADKTILFIMHYDVVPAKKEEWDTNPFILFEKDGKWYGRGTSDDKGNIVALLGAIKELGKENVRYNIRIILTCDEEIGGKYGLEYLITNHKYLFKNIDATFILDSDFSYIASGCSGIIGGRVSFKGKKGHAGYPHITPNIVHKMISFLSDLKKYEQEIDKIKSIKKIIDTNTSHRNVWKRFNITIIKVGEKRSILPDKGEAIFDLRLLPEEDVNVAWNHFINYFNVLKEKYEDNSFKIDVEMIYSHKGYFVDDNYIWIRKFNDVIKNVLGYKLEICAELGKTDGAIVAKINLPSVGFGVGERFNNIHGNNEFVRISTLMTVKKILLEFLKK